MPELRKGMNRHRLVCMYVHTLPACLWMLDLIFALLPVMELRCETGERVAVTLDPHTGP